MTLLNDDPNAAQRRTECYAYLYEPHTVPVLSDLLGLLKPVTNIVPRASSIATAVLSKREV